MRENRMWFGTNPGRMGWIPAPNTGADSSPEGWSADDTYLNGGGSVRHSWSTHKQYIYEWPGSSTPEEAQWLKSYRDGTYGRGLLYFVEPNAYERNVLPARWADFSMALGYEGGTHVTGVEPTALPVSGGQSNNLPVTSAYYGLDMVQPGYRGDQDSLFVPLPEGYTLYLGAMYQYTGAGGIFAAPVDAAGAVGTAVRLTTIANDSSVLLSDTFANVAGVRIWIGKDYPTSASVTAVAMLGRLTKTTNTGLVATNLFTNPSFETLSGSTVEVRRNYVLKPLPDSGSGTWGAHIGAGTKTHTVVSGAGPEGQDVMRTQATVDGVTLGYGMHTGSLPVGRYALSAYVRASRSGTSIRSYKQGTSVSTIVSQVDRMSDGTWQRVSQILDVTTAGTIQSGYLVNNSADTLAGDYVDFTKVQVEKSTILGDYFDGSTSPDSDLTPSWVGTANASESVLSGQVAMMASNSSPGNLAVYRSGAWADSGDFSVALYAIKSSETSRGLLAVSSGSVKPLTTYTLKVKTRVRGSVTVARAFRVKEGAAPFGVVGEFFPAGTVLSGVQEWETTLTTAGAHSGGLNAEPPASGAAGETVWYDSLLVVEGEYTGPFFDGNTNPDPNRYTVAWTGTANDSTSTLTRSPSVAFKGGPWVGGMGHSGCRFLAPPTFVSNSAVNGGQVTYAASFSEVGSWE